MIDERKLGDILPKFVAENLSKIPFVDADSINILAMAKNLETIEKRMSTVENFLAFSCDKVTDKRGDTNGNDGDLRLDRTKTVSPLVAPDHSTLNCTADGEGMSAIQSAPDGHGEWSTVVRLRKTTTGTQQQNNSNIVKSLVLVMRQIRW